MKPRQRSRIYGQGLAEYAGAIALSALMAAAMIGGANTFMPTLFQTLTSNHEAALGSKNPAHAEPDLAPSSETDAPDGCDADTDSQSPC